MRSQHIQWVVCEAKAPFHLSSNLEGTVVALRPTAPCFMSHALQRPFKQRQVETRTCWSKINTIILEWLLSEDVR